MTRWRRTLLAVRIVAPDGDEYMVRAARMLWPRDPLAPEPVSDLLPEPAGVVVDASSLLGRIRWAVRVTRRNGRLRPGSLVYCEYPPTAREAVQRTRTIAVQLEQRRRPPLKQRG